MQENAFGFALDMFFKHNYYFDSESIYNPQELQIRILPFDGLEFRYLKIVNS